MQKLFIQPFRDNPRRQDRQQYQFEYIKLKSWKGMSLNMCQIFNQLNNKKWNINIRGFSIQQYKQLIDMIVDCEPYEVNMVGNGNPSIVSLMMAPRFNNLQELNLTWNKICTIEALQFVHMPMLALLQLSNNHICTLKALGKSSFPQLQYFQIHFNQIRNPQELQIFSRIIRKPNKPLLNLVGYVFEENQRPEMFEFTDKYIQFDDQVIERQNQPPNFTTVSSKHQMIVRQDLNVQEIDPRKLIPFLAKAWLPGQKDRRPKIHF